MENIEDLDITTETLTCAIASTTATAKTFTIAHRQDYDVCIGIAGYINKQNAADIVSIAANDFNGKSLFDNVNQGDVVVSNVTAWKERYRTAKFPTKGKTTKITITPLAALVGDFSIDIVFKVKKNVC